MNKFIKADLYRYSQKQGLKSLIAALIIPGFRYMYLLRKASVCKKYSPAGLFFRILIRRYMFKYGFQIPVSTEIGPGFYIDHFGTIVINEKAKIGKL